MTTTLPVLDKLQPNPHWAKLPFFDRKGWKTVRFGDVVRMLKEQVDPIADGVERYVAGEHMETENVHICKWGNVGDGYLGPAFIRRFRKGQVLYGSRRTYLKKVALAEWDGVTANTTFVLEAVEGRFLQELLPWLMLSERFTKHSIKESKGSTNPYINFPDIAKFEFTLPPLDQQRRIAEILWAVDEALLRQVTLDKSLSDGLCAERNAFFLKAQKFKTEPVENLFQVQLGKMLSPKSKRGVSPLPYLGNKNVQWGRIDLSEVQEMDFSPQEKEKFRLQPGDLLVCEGGEVGRSAIWDGQIEDCCFQKAVHRLRSLDGALSTDYMFEFMMWGNTKGLFSSLTGHSTIAHLTAIKLKSMHVPVVSHVTQEGLLERLGVFKCALNASQKHQEQTVRLRTTLLQQIE
jgi:type I restriction enzyme S subunit